MDANGTIADAGKGDGQPANKYIRTFEGDMSTQKRGGVPELDPPIKSPPPAPPASESPKENVPPPPPPMSIPAAGPPPPAALSTPGFIQGSERSKEGPSPIKTYAEDFQVKVKKEHASEATILAAEQDSATGAPPSPEVTEPPSRRNLIYGIVGTVLLIAAAAGAYLAYTKYLSANAPVIPAVSVSAPIFVDDRVQLSGDGTALQQAIMQSAAKPLARGTVRLLSMMGTTTASTSVFALLNVSAPSLLLRNVNAKGSMAGIVNVNGSQTPFFILSVASYDDTFAGMLSWERMMPRNLSALFAAYPASAVVAATTTPPTATLPRNANLEQVFQDEVVANHDVRVYRDATGRSILLYGYWNQATLVIARDEAAFTEIVQRLATSRAQ